MQNLVQYSLDLDLVKRDRSTKFFMCTDSMSSLEAIQNRKLDQPFILEIYSKLANLSNLRKSVFSFGLQDVLTFLATNDQTRRLEKHCGWTSSGCPLWCGGSHYYCKKLSSRYRPGHPHLFIRQVKYSGEILAS